MGDAAPRPVSPGPFLSAPSGSSGGGCCKRALASTAELGGKRPARVCRTKRSAERGASLPHHHHPPASLTSSSLPLSLPPSLSSSLPPAPLRSPPPLTERLPYKIYESALSSRCRAPSYSQGSDAQPCGAASQGVFAAPAPGDDPWPASVQVPDPALGPVVEPLVRPSPAPQSSQNQAAAQPSPAPARSPFRAGGHREKRLKTCVLTRGWDPRTATQSPNHKSALLPHLLPG